MADDWPAAWHTAILAVYEGLSEQELSNPAKDLWLPAPTRHWSPRTFDGEQFHVVGRKSFSQLLQFARKLMEPSKLPKLLPKVLDELAEQVKLAQGVEERLAMFRGGRGYVIGTAGGGKSYLLAQLAGFLHAEGKWVVVHLSAARLSYPTLRSSLILAFARFPAAVHELRTIQDADLFTWLMGKPKMLFLVDDSNELDPKPTLHERQCSRYRCYRGSCSWCQVEQDAQLWKEELDELSGRHVVVYCGSYRNKVLANVQYEPHLVLDGGFSSEEFKTFERTFVGQTLGNEVLYSTGFNPRLLQMHTEGKLDDELTALRESLQKFAAELFETNCDRDEFVAHLAGAPVKQALPMAMEARCFYVGKDGTLEAICDELKSVALISCVQLAKKLERGSVEEHIAEFARWLSCSNMVRTGWNAEEATFLCLGALPVGINLEGETWDFRAEDVKLFSGGIRGAQLEGSGRQILHLPTKFNCKAVDSMVEGVVARKKVVAGVQVSLNQDPHGGAIEEFCRVVQNRGYDIVVFIWIGYFPSDFSPRKIKVGQQEVVEVTLSFKSVHSLLTPVEYLCANIREAQLTTGERVQCPVLANSVV